MSLSVTMFASFHLSTYAGPYMGAITLTTAYRGRVGGGGELVGHTTRYCKMTLSHAKNQHLHMNGNC